MPKPPETDEEVGVRPGSFENFEPGPLPPAASPDGVPNTASFLAPEKPRLRVIPENSVCVRGPCKHFVEMRSEGDLESRHLDYDPEAIERYCLIAGSPPLEVESCVFSCSSWDPLAEDHAREQRRTAYLAAHPECTRADATRKERREVALAKIKAEADERDRKRLAEEAEKKSEQQKEWT